MDPADPTSVNPNLLCRLCWKLPITPMQTPCGCRYCESCIKKYLQKKEPQICPGGFPECKDLNSNQIRKDPGAEREIRNLLVKCRNQQCNQNIKASKFQDHIDNQCEYNRTICEICRENVLSKNINGHKESYCKYRKVTCQYCASSFRCDLLEKHLNILEKECCKGFRSICPHCSTGDFNSVTILDHREQCEKWSVPCDFEGEGCKREGTKSDMQEHCKKDVGEHLVLLSKTAKGQISILENNNTKLSTLKENLEGLEKRIYNAKHLVKGAQLLACELSPLSSNVSSPSAATRQSNTRGRVDGKLIWKITDYNNKKQQELSLSSDPFFTGEFGYKLCMRVYLNGDGAGKGTHISMFLVVMKGEYDDLLSWPFKQTVSLSVLDQTGNRNHLSDTFRPDPNSQCYTQPTSDQNMASGCPQLAPHTVIEGREGMPSRYLRNDTIFVSATIDLRNLPAI